MIQALYVSLYLTLLIALGYLARNPAREFDAVLRRVK
jgi:hypothetical protein